MTRHRHRVPSSVLIDGVRYHRDELMPQAAPGVSWELLYQRLSRDKRSLAVALSMSPDERSSTYWLVQSLLREAVPWLYSNAHTAGTPKDVT